VRVIRYRRTIIPSLHNFQKGEKKESVDSREEDSGVKVKAQDWDREERQIQEKGQEGGAKDEAKKRVHTAESPGKGGGGEETGAEFSQGTHP